MNIDFYYVNGLTKVDTLYFDSLEHQQEFFNNHKVVSYVDEAYYPPHYNVELKVDAEDINLNQSINYVSLYYNNKYYYYFIASINYENEEVWTLSLEMDTIQTYLFNINKVVGTVERKSIDRWTNFGINRNYERENLSESEFVNYSYKELKFDDDIEFELYKWRKYDDSETKVIYDNKEVISHFDTIIRFKYYNGKKIVRVLWGGIPHTKDNQFSLIDENWCYMGSYHRSLKEIAPNYHISSLETSPNEYELVLEPSPYNPLFKNVNDGAKSEIAISILPLTNYVPSFTTDAIFIKNTSLQALRNYKYTPFLLDNQYIKILYGERYNTQEIPLFLYDKDVFEIKIYNDIINNSRNYCVGDIRDDVNLTLLTCDAPETIEIFSDPWKNYMSQNQASLTSGKFVLDPLIKGIAAGAMSGNPAVGVAVGGGALVKNVINYGNLKQAPDTVRQTGGYAPDVLFKNITPIIKIDMVKDIQNISNLVESIGYKVNETISSINFFSEMNIRYYYNVVKMSECSITLNVLQDAETVNNIKSRLEDGIRMWNVSDTNVIGDYTYDNVEKRYI